MEIAELLDNALIYSEDYAKSYHDGFWEGRKLLAKYNEQRRRPIDAKYEELEPEDIEGMTEEERWAYEELLEGVSLATTKEKLDWECRELERLIGLAKEAERARSEVKLGELKRLVDD